MANKIQRSVVKMKNKNKNKKWVTRWRESDLKRLRLFAVEKERERERNKPCKERKMKTEMKAKQSCCGCFCKQHHKHKHKTQNTKKGHYFVFNVFWNQILFCEGLILRRDLLPLLCFCCCVKKFKFFLFQVGEVEHEHTFLEKTVWIWQGLEFYI